MANNFRKTGAFYISPDGNDANSGLAADLPKRSFGFYGAGSHVAGAGEYKGAFYLNNGQQANVFEADGMVKLNCTANMVLAAFFGFANTTMISFFVELNGFAIAANLTGIFLEKTVLKNGQINLSGFAAGGVESSVLESVIVTGGFFGISKSMVFNSTIFNADSCTSSYVDGSSVLNIPTYFATPATHFKKNNFRGQVVVDGTAYELKKKKDGTAINPNPGVADLATIDAGVYSRGNFSEDPLFLNLAKGDYWAVNPASPSLFAAEGGTTNIGGVFAAISVAATDPAFASPAANNGTADFAGGIVWASPPGTRLSQPVQVATAEGRPLKKGVIAALLNFNSLEAIGSAENKDVTASNNYAPGTAGANPRRVKTIKMRIKSTMAAPVNDASFDNNGYITAGDFFDFEVLGEDTDFLVDVTGKGTGDPLFNPIGAAYTSPVWVQELLTVQEGVG